MRNNNPRFSLTESSEEDKQGYLLKGNAYVPRAKIEKLFGVTQDELSSAEPIFHGFEVDYFRRTLEYRLSDFIIEYRIGQGIDMEDPQMRENITSEERLKAEEAGIFNEPKLVPLYPDNSVFHLSIEKAIADCRYANKKRGHRFNEYRRRKKKNNKRKAGGGFSFKPEIPHRQSGTGAFYVDETDYVDEPDIDYRIEEPIVPKYDRKNHPPQSLRKEEWQVGRRWKNKRRNYLNNIFLQ